MTGEVELKGLTKLYGDFVAVDGVTLNVPEGAFVALLGSSGAGKSTVLRMIGGFEIPDSGQILIGGRDVTGLPPYRRDVNTVFQNYALFPHMSVAENVAYGLRQDRVPGEQRRRRVRDALEMVQMAHLAGRNPVALSGGQQQRVALARALVKRPSVLLLDEPLGALDRKLRQQMQVELKLLQHQLGITFIFVTHDQEEALAMSDTIAVMRDGRIDQVGTPAELYDRPRTAFVAGFIGAQNFISGRAMAGAPRLAAGNGLVVDAGHAADAVAAGDRALAAIRPEHVRISSDEPSGSGNKAPASVAAVVMLGDTVEYVLRLADGTDLLSRQPRSAPGLPAQGAAVWLSWSKERVCLFPFEEMVVQSRAFAGSRNASPGGSQDGEATA
jgi:spermidine/putrescine transport system ATP-binding protein